MLQSLLGRDAREEIEFAAKSVLEMSRLLVALLASLVFVSNNFVHLKMCDEFADRLPPGKQTSVSMAVIGVL